MVAQDEVGGRGFCAPALRLIARLTPVEAFLNIFVPCHYSLLSENNLAGGVRLLRVPRCGLH